MPIKSSKNRKYRNVVAAVIDEPWAIREEKLSQILDVLNTRAAGYQFTRQEVAQRLERARGETVGMEPRSFLDEDDFDDDGRLIVRNEHGGHTDGRVALLSLRGVLSNRFNLFSYFSGGTSYELFTDRLARAVDDSNVKAIVIDIDSPGGTVHGCMECAERIFEAREAKPIYGVANAGAYSAAYWTGSAVKTLAVTPSGSVGSIGVLQVHHSFAEANKKFGIEATYITAGKHKAEVNPDTALSDDTKAYLQGVTDTYYGYFVDAIAKHRGVSTEKVRSQFGQGRIVLAEQAQRLGMVDRIATLEQILAELGVGRFTASAAAGDSADIGASRKKPKRASASSFLSFELSNMKPEVFKALVRAGLIDVDASEATANAVLSVWFKGRGESVPEDPAAIIKALEDHAVAGKATPPATPPAAPAPATNPATGSENRVSDIMAAVTIAGGIPDAEKFAFAQGLIADQSLTVQGAIAKIRERQAEGNQAAGTTRIAVEQDRVDKFAAVACDAMLTRIWKKDLPETVFDRRANDFVAWKPQRGERHLQSLHGLGRECLAINGANPNVVRNLTNDQLARATMGLMSQGEMYSLGIYAGGGPTYNTSGDFANLLLDAANKVLRRSYEEVNTTFQVWAKQGESLKDFKFVNKVISGETADPKAIPEDGEFEETTLTDAKERYRLTVWGFVFSLTWQAFVNDDLGAFGELEEKHARAMRRKQNKLAYGILKDNPTLADTGALFNNTAQTTAGGHANLTSIGPPSVAAFNTIWKAMAEKFGLNPEEQTALGIEPTYVLGPPALRGTLLELLGSTSNPASTNSNVRNIWENKLKPVIDAQLGAACGGSDTAYFLAADSRDVDHIEYAYLEGLETPAMDQHVSFERLALRHRMYQAWATKAIDARGIHMDDGIA